MNRSKKISLFILCTSFSGMPFASANSSSDNNSGSPISACREAVQGRLTGLLKGHLAEMEIIEVGSYQDAKGKNVLVQVQLPKAQVEEIKSLAAVQSEKTIAMIINDPKNAYESIRANDRTKEIKLTPQTQELIDLVKQQVIGIEDPETQEPTVIGTVKDINGNISQLRESTAHLIQNNSSGGSWISRLLPSNRKLDQEGIRIDHAVEQLLETTKNNTAVLVDHSDLLKKASIAVANGNEELRVRWTENHFRTIHIEDLIKSQEYKDFLAASGDRAATISKVINEVRLRLAQEASDIATLVSHNTKMSAEFYVLQDAIDAAIRDGNRTTEIYLALFTGQILVGQAQQQVIASQNQTHQMRKNLTSNTTKIANNFSIMKTNRLQLENAVVSATQLQDALVELENLSSDYAGSLENRIKAIISSGRQILNTSARAESISRNTISSALGNEHSFGISLPPPSEEPEETQTTKKK